MLSIEANFTIKELEKDFNKFTEAIKNDLAGKLFETLKILVDKARRKTKAEKGFGNITWNLRASIGGVIVKDHRIVHRYFPPIPLGVEGNLKGIAYAEEIALLLDDGDIMLIMVAGMDYAKHVECTERDVITGSSLYFEQEFKRLLATIK